MSDTDTRDRDTGYQPTVTRRGALRLGAGAVTASAIGGTYAIQQTRAVAPIVAAAAIQGGITAVTGASVAGYRYLSADEDEVDVAEVQEDTVQQSTWEQATTLNRGREDFVDELRYDYGLDRAVDTIQTAHGSSMFSAVETEIARSRVDGEDQATAEESARDELNRYTATAIWNNISRWNGWFHAGAEIIKYSVTDDGVLTPSSGSFDTLSNARTDADPAQVDPIVETESGDIYVWSDPLDGPNVDLPDWMDISQIDEEEVDVDDLHVTRYAVDGTVVDVINDQATDHNLIADHPDHGTETVAEPSLYADLIDTTWTLRDDISADLSTTVDSIYQQFDIGERDPSDIISNQEILQQFDPSDGLSEQSAVAALVARGYALPSDLEETVTITHNDLEGETSGYLFLDAGEQINAVAGTTISANQYEMGHIVYESAVDGSIQSESLSGDYPLDIVEYSGEQRHSVDYTTVDEVTSPSYIVIRETHEILENPGEYSAVLRAVDGDGAEAMISLEDVTEYTGDHYDSEVSDGEYQAEIPDNLDAYDYGIDTVEIVEGLQFDDRSERHISNPTDPDETRDRVESNNEAWERIEEKLDDLVGGAGGGGSGSDWTLYAALVAAGGALAAILAGDN
ncbi:hypothetical protein SAMN05444422_1034 [Halobiforma haloterrestris]|uniref:Envelope protein N-terminal domain-containing protein n=1 Tax=Natronobacterium haloterrestre TaxID=148448 RepID=A0A1I1F137_NATHA|nr:hypothetical protein [Halobiforma haloterrestris]SFB91468.1 hypothetical protein SAMN05444422_1034 [Halobiforma haloterrestris]